MEAVKNASRALWGECSSRPETDPNKTAKTDLATRFLIDKTKQFGEGGYGVTVGATDLQTGEKLACKIIDLRKSKKEAIAKECLILETLSHVHIISMRGHGVGYGGLEENAHLYFIFMEVAEGGELFDQVMDHGQIPEQSARIWFCQMLDAINYCQLAGVAHRDIKLENVLLNGDRSQAKVIDFGLSHVYPVDRSTGVTIVDRSKPLRDVCGSKSYAAPEVLGQRGYDGFAADMWSLGVCLFAMLSGFFPLDEAAPRDWRFNALLNAQRQGRSTVATVYQFYKRSPSHLSKSVIHMLDRMLDMDPARRMTMAEARQHPWVTGKLAPPSQDSDAVITVDGDEPLYRGINQSVLWDAPDHDMLDDEPVCERSPSLEP